MIMPIFLILLLADPGEAPGPGAGLDWINNLGDEIHWQNDSLEQITWTQN